ncbi:MAG: tetratricopeptide repeat protein [Nitrospirae bacterium]|nr:MAG: tetratricopeptide repeat protein [Nitrospirota bacterium]
MNSFLNNKNKLPVLLFVFVATLVVYSPAVSNKFVNWDDHAYVYQNPNIMSLNLDFFEWAFLYFHSSNWHPLTWISHAVDYALWGLNPAGHHFTSIFWHSLNAALVALLGVNLIEHRKRIAANGNAGLSEKYILAAGLFSGLFFGLHPIHVESVVWVSERKDVLCAFFFLLSMLAYLQYAYKAKQEPQVAIKLWLTNKYYLLTLGFFFMALLSKPMAVTLPVVLCILDWYPFERFNRFSAKRVFLEKVPFFLISLDLAVTTVLAQSYNYAVKSASEFPLFARLLVGFRALLDYFVNMLLPLSLSPLYPFPDEASFFSIKYGLGLVGVVFFAALLVIRNNKIWSSIWLYYFIMLLPVLGFIKVGIASMADRYMYLPSVSLGLGAALLYVSGLRRLQSVNKRIVAAGGAAFFILLFVPMSFLTVKQALVWKDSQTLWEFAFDRLKERGEENYKNSYDVYHSLAWAYEEIGRRDDAIYQLKANAARVSPYSMHVYNALGIIYQKMENYEEAIEAYKTALKIYPFNNVIRNNLSVAYIRKGKIDKAIDELNEALKINPVFYLTHNNLGVAYMESGRYEEAITKFKIVMKLNSNFKEARGFLVEAYIRQGIDYEKEGKLNDAIGSFKEAAALDQINVKMTEYEVNKRIEQIEATMKRR